ncbi:MAG: hypothetical protein AAGU21_01070 [Solidesulfovibrio sp.]|uniref:hypothetical protein n=1 Tax=Solidesulfovibrio sp. TaxID=2910990 RepID=UPI002B1F77CF|nr:hypothetical protein [Solidesulfovibrio sp.]MEA4857911.1 hypothetical protein [Solidesulfovibrio sp.]
MGVLTLASFSGQGPRTSPGLLRDNMAVAAMNCDLASGEIRAFKDTQAVWTPTKPGYLETIYLYERSFWFHWATDVDVVKGPIIDDEAKRVYFTGDGKPKLTTLALATQGQGTNYPLASRPLGIPAPDSTDDKHPLTVTPGGGVTENARSVTYVYTYVSDLGEEGPPNTASDVVTTHNGETVGLGGFRPPPEGYACITRLRIYRAASGSGGSTYFQFVAEVDADTVTWNDQVLDKDLVEVLPSATWKAPPENLRGLVSMPGGLMAGFFDKTVCFCEPYYPHAWPTAYQYPVDFPIVALGVFGSTLAVLTEGHPYLMSVSHPSVVQSAKHPNPQGCVSKKGVVSSELGVIFPTPDGLFLLSDNQSGLIARDLVTKRDWRNFNPATLRAVVHDGRYWGFYRKEVTAEGEILGGGFVFDPQDQDVRFTEVDFFAHCAQSIPESDDLFFVFRGNGINTIHKWDSGTAPRPYVWRSKTWEMSPRNFAAARVEANFEAPLTPAELAQRQALRQAVIDANQARIEAYFDEQGGLLAGVDGGLAMAPVADVLFAGDLLETPPVVDISRRYVDFKLIVDDLVRFVHRVADPKPFRLPGGYTGRKVQIEIAGTADVKKVLVGTSVTALAQ